MFHIKINNISIAVVFTMAMFFSCTNDFKAIQNIDAIENAPIAEAININLEYTEFENDTVRLIANLISPKLLDFTNQTVATMEFPEGIELRVYDKQGQKTTVFADYAIMYNDTNIIDLQNNVVIATHDKDTLFTDQLYYHRTAEWLFTNEPFYFKRQAGFTQGNGFDSDKEFKKRQILEMGGDFEFDKVKD